MATRIATFTAVQGTSLTDYNAVGEPRFTRVGGSGSAQITSAGRVRCDSASLSEFIDDTAFSSADYSVSATIRFLSSTPFGYVGVLGRSDVNGSPLYMARYSPGAGNWELFRLGAPGASSLGTFPQVLSLDTDYVLKLDMVGTTIRLLVDGVEQVIVTDASVNTAGHAGLIFSASTTDTTGQQADTFTVTGTGVSAPAAPGTKPALWLFNILG